MAQRQIFLTLGAVTSNIVGPDAYAHLMHYFENTGSTYTIRLAKMISDVPSAKKLFDKELSQAMKFTETLTPMLLDEYDNIDSKNASQGYNKQAESKNWYFAVGGYSAFGKGRANVCGTGYKLDFDYEFRDRYNWDGGKSVDLGSALGGIISFPITDAYMQNFHLYGLAKEFDMVGHVYANVRWKKGQTINDINVNISTIPPGSPFPL